MITFYKLENPTDPLSYLAQKANFFYERRFCCQYNNTRTLSSKESCKSHDRNNANLIVSNSLTSICNEKARKPQLIYGPRGTYANNANLPGDLQEHPPTRKLGVFLCTLEKYRYYNQEKFALR
jgi:hypothetical protein